MVAEELTDLFTLSVFQRDLTVTAADQFSEEYGVDRKILGPKSKLFLHKLWDTLVWMEVTSTKMLIISIKDQMETKGRIKNGVFRCGFHSGK